MFGYCVFTGCSKLVPSDVNDEDNNAVVTYCTSALQSYDAEDSDIEVEEAEID